MAIYNQDVKQFTVLKEILSEPITLNGSIFEHADVKFISQTSTVDVNNKIYDHGNLLVVAEKDISVKGEFGGNSIVKLVSKSGKVTIGKDGEQKNVDGNANLRIIASRDVLFYHSDLNSNCIVNIECKEGNVVMKGDINSETKLSIIAKGSISFNGDINSQALVEMVSTEGSISIHGHINGDGRTRLIAAQNIYVEKEVDGNLSFFARCEGTITVGSKINNNAFAELRAHQGITINGNVSDNSTVFVSTDSNDCTILGDVSDNSTVHHTPVTNLIIQGNGHGTLDSWITEFRPNDANGELGTWWNNWGWTYGYLSKNFHKPKTYAELVALIAPLRYRDRVKAVGGGWSFSDGALPQDSDQSVDRVSILKRGKGTSNDLRKELRDFELRTTKMEVYPFEVAHSLEFTSQYQLSTFQRKAVSGIDLKIAEFNYHTVDTRNIASSLQHNLKKQSIPGKEGQPIYRYWVEAGITIATLNELLDHHSPRLALEASGGSPGATLAGTISTATHGGEFANPLLIDRIVAVHLIGPGGLEWWIEGNNEVIDLADLQALYPSIPPNRFVATSNPGWPNNQLDAETVLRSVITSMGAMGVIYSVVLEVVPQFAIEQVSVKFESWDKLLEAAGTTANNLGNLEGNANTAVLNFLLDGTKNKSGIALNQNKYVDLAINPIHQSCWVVNRRFQTIIAEDDNSLDIISNYVSSFTSKMTEGADSDGFLNNELVGRMVDFLKIDRSAPQIALQLGDLLKFMGAIKGNGMMISSALGLIHKRGTENHIDPNDNRSGFQFLGDLLEVVLDALQGTFEEPKASTAGLSHRVGAIGWPSTGLTGRGFEVAVRPDIAFSYVNALIEELYDMAKNQGKAILGYISIRICPQTKTMLGMQQFDRFNVMVEVVAHRNPETSIVFDHLIEFTKTWEGFTEGNFPPFHWGLEAEMMDFVYAKKTPWGQMYNNTGFTRLEIFKMVKDYIQAGHDPVFDNRFVSRMGF